MATSSQIALPLDILLCIAHLLAIDHYPSLKSFSLVNKVFHMAARPSILHSLTLSVTGPRKLQKDLAKAGGVLGINGGFEYVRCLTVDGEMCGERDETDEPPEWTLSDSNYYGEDEIYGLEEYGDEVFGGDGPPISEEEDRRWQPLVTFLEHTIFLDRLIWKPYSQFPPCLLTLLHTRLTRCKLDIYKFRFRTLRDAATNAHELALATSPSLHAVGIRFTWRDSDGHDDYNEEACLQMISSMAPSLASVTFLKCRPASSPESYRSRHRPRVPWQGFRPAQKDSGRARLSSLSLMGYEMDNKMYDLKAMTDFRYLRRLKVEWRLTNIALEAMQSFVSDFSCLKELSIQLCRNDQPSQIFASEEYMIRFMEMLPPLQVLHLGGRVGFSLFSAVVARHGSTLRSLSISPKREEGHPDASLLKYIRLLEDHCPLLEDLCTTVKRAKSSVREATVYSSIGRLTRLKHLLLRLDCSNPEIQDEANPKDDPTFDEFDLQVFNHGTGSPNRTLRYGHVRDAYINSAVDESLARSIFNVIVSSHPQSRSRLQTLKLAAFGGCSYGRNCYQTDVDGIIRYLNRSYLLEKSPRDDSDEVFVKELGERAREARDQRHREVENLAIERQSDFKEPPSLQIFRRIWPPLTEGCRDWRGDWKSFPLELA